MNVCKNCGERDGFSRVETRTYKVTYDTDGDLLDKEYADLAGCNAFYCDGCGHSGFDLDQLTCSQEEWDEQHSEDEEDEEQESPDEHPNDEIL